jgi:hypothetical protein
MKETIIRAIFGMAIALSTASCTSETIEAPPAGATQPHGYI